MTVWPFVLYAILNITGGIIGYVKSGSVISLVMGSSSGALLLIFAHFAYRGSQTAYYLGLGVVVLLSAFFAFRLVKTHNFMPAGLMLIIGVLLIAYLLFRKIVQP